MQDRTRPSTTELMKSDLGWSFSCRAVALSMRALVLTIIATIALGGCLLTAILIGLDTSTGATVPRGLILGLGGILGVALMGVLSAFWWWRAQTLSVEFSTSHIQVQTGRAAVAVPLDQVETIIIRCDSDYARVEIARKNDTQLSYFAGLCRQPGKLPGQDAIPYPKPAVLTFFRQVGFEVRLAKDPREGRIIRLFRAAP